MSGILFLLGSGWAFFIGIAMILGGVVGRMSTSRRWLDRVWVYAAELGLVIVVLSGMPLPYWLYAVATGATLLWLATEKSPPWQKRRPWVRCAVISTWLAAMALEAPHLPAPTVTVQEPAQLHIIADSITAGLHGAEVTWPRLLRQSSKLEIHDHSQAGATTADAVAQADDIPAERCLVLIEIGGNDLLGPTTAKEFREALDRLLTKVASPDHQVLMFELPLLPLCNEFPRAQRDLATQHHVTLIPRRLFMRVLASATGTTDSIHLSQAGHEEMAKLVRSSINIDPH